MAGLICLPQVLAKERERERKIESYKGLYQLAFKEDVVRSTSSSSSSTSMKEDGRKDLFV